MIRRTDLIIRITVVVILVGLGLWRIFPLDKNLKLGLDLKGGMYLVIKADTARIPKASVSPRSAFSPEDLKILVDNEIVKLSDDENDVLWALTTEEKLRPRLAALDIQDVDNLVDIWRRSATEKVGEAVRIAAEVIRKRIEKKSDEYGTKEYMIQIQGNVSFYPFRYYLKKS